MDEKEPVLYICGNLFPLDSGSAIYSYGNIDRFSEHFRIDLLSFVQEEPSGEYFSLLVKKINTYSWFFFEKELYYFIRYGLTHRVLFQKFSRKMIEEINFRLEKKSYKYIIFDGFLTFYLVKEINRNEAQIILIEQNIEYKNLKEEITFASSYRDKILKKIRSFNLRNFEKKILNQGDILLFITDQDKRDAEELLGRKPFGFVLSPFFPFSRIKSREELAQNTFNLLILGSMWWYPNVHGAIWFILEVFPYIQQIDPRYRVLIVGKDPPEELLQYNSEAVRITGSVPSVDEYIRSSDFLIVPNTLGGGIKMKIYEGIMKGIPVLARPESIQGYPSCLFPDNYLAQDPKSFAQMIVNQNQDLKTKITFLENGQRCLTAFSDISYLVKKIEEIFQEKPP